MWEVRNHTPFACAGYFVRDRNGAEHWVVALSACFDIRADGLLALAEEQIPPRLAPVYKDDDAHELLAESDLAPFRPLPDILVLGSVCQPDRKAFRRYEAALILGVWKKQAAIFAPRLLRKTNDRFSIEQDAEIVSAPLSWTLSLGGPDALDPAAEPHPYNPIGCGWTAQWDRLPNGLALNLPCIENPFDLIALHKPLPAPHGLGALQPVWRPRRDHAGTYDDAWRKSRMPLPPQDFLEKFHQSVSRDQVYPEPLQGGAAVEATGFHPDGPYRFHLPQMIAEARIEIGSDEYEARLRLIGVELEADKKKLRLVYNASAPCNGRDHLVRKTIVRLRQMAGVV